MLSGITKSSLPNDIPALKACLNPRSFNLSQNITVLFWPENLNTWSITSETIYFGSNLSTRANLLFKFFGIKFANKNLPAVLMSFSYFVYPFSSTVANLEAILEWTLIWPISKACSISEVFTLYPSTLSVCYGGWER